MLCMQQASAVVGARQRIVEGAVGMVQLALQRLEAEGAASRSRRWRPDMAYLHSPATPLGGYG